MNKITFDFTNGTVEITGEDLYDSHLPNFDLVMKLGMALRAAMQSDKNIAVAVQSAAMDYTAGTGKDYRTILNEFFPAGYKPSQFHGNETKQ